MCDPSKTSCVQGRAGAFETLTRQLSEWSPWSAPAQNLSVQAPANFSRAEVSLESFQGATPGQTMTPGQRRLFTDPSSASGLLSQVKKDAEETPPLGIPTTLLERLLLRFPEGSGAQLLGSSPASTAVRLLQRPDGSFEVAGKYFDMVQEGIQSAHELRETLEKISDEPDLEKRRALIKQANQLNELYGKAAKVAWDTYTRSNRSEFQTIENWVGSLYEERRSQNPGTEPGLLESRPVELTGLMLGFDLTAINKKDQNYKEGTGTAVKHLMEYVAHELAPKFGGKILGVWGTNVVVKDIPAEQTDAFRAAVQKRVMHYLRREFLPEEVSKRVYGMDGELYLNAGKLKVQVPKIRTDSLKARDWLIKKPDNLGVTAGWQSTTIDLNDVQPGEVELKVITQLEQMAEAEAEARRVGEKFFCGSVAEDSPVKGRMGRPLLRAEPVLTQSPHQAAPVAPGEYQTGLDEAAIRDGLPNPAREGSVSYQHYRALKNQLRGIRALSEMDVPSAFKLALKGMPESLDQPVSQRLHDVQGGGMVESLERTYALSLEQHRFPGIKRLEFFPELARRSFEGEKFYIQMFEYRDYWGHNREHRPDAKDGLHRLTLDIQVEGYNYHNLDIITATGGGDEIMHAIRGRTLDGKKLTPADIERISGYLADHFNHIFEALDHQRVVKIPSADAAGLFVDSKNRERPYIIKDQKVYLEEHLPNLSERRAFLKYLERAHGYFLNFRDIKVVKSLSEVASLERMRLWQKISESGHRLLILAREGEAPKGFDQVIIPLSTTITPAVEIPARAGQKEVELAMKTVGELADKMKRLGIDRPLSAENARRLEIGLSGKEVEVIKPVLKLSTLHRISAAPWGKKVLTTGANGALYLAGEIGSEILLYDFGGKPGRYFDAKGAAELAVTGAAIFGGSFAGEKGVRFVLRTPVPAEAGLWRGAAIRGGSFLAPLAMISAMHSEDGRPQFKDIWNMGLGMGEAMAVVRGSAWFTGLTLGEIGTIIQSPFLMNLRGMTSRAGFVGMAATAVTVAGEFAYLKYRGDRAWHDVMAAQAAESRLNLAKAMQNADQLIQSEKWNHLLQGWGKEGEKQDYRAALAALETAREHALSHLGILGIWKTEEGKQWMEASGKLAAAQRKFAEESKDWEKREKASEALYFISSPGIATRSPQRRYEDAKKDLEEAEALESKHRRIFEKRLEDICQNDWQGDPSIPIQDNVPTVPSLGYYQNKITMEIASFVRQWKNYQDSRLGLTH